MCACMLKYLSMAAISEKSGYKQKCDRTLSQWGATGELLIQILILIKMDGLGLWGISLKLSGSRLPQLLYDIDIDGHITAM